MGLFDIFGTSDQTAAANAQSSSINSGYNQLAQLYGTAGTTLDTNAIAAGGALSTNNDTGTNALQGYYNQGAGALSQGYNAGLGSLYGGANAGLSSLYGGYGSGLQSLYGGYGQAAGAIGQGYGSALSGLYGAYGQGANALNSTYAAGLSPYLQNYGSSQAGVNQLGNLLGLNGAAGNASALQSLENTPGYQFALQQGDNAILAQQAATGQLASGNTDIALSNYNQGLASTTYQNAVNNLQPYLGYSTSSAGGIQSGYSGLGNQLSGLYQGLGQGSANLQSGEAQQLGNIYTGLGTQSAGLQTGLGTAAANLQSSTGSQAAGLQSGLGTGISNIYTGLGNTTNTNYQNLGTNLANVYTGLGTQQANLQQSQGNAAYGAQTSIGNAQANADLAGLSASSNLWGGLLSGVGLGLGAYGAFSKSDERSKDDIEEVGRLHSGEPVVRFRYKGEPRHQIGLIAQHVEKVTPDAVREFHTDVRPMKYVDYKRATDLAAGLAKFLKEAA